MNEKKLAIFDLDGTLFCTKDVNYHSYQKALNECGINIKIEYNFYCEYCNGNSYKVFLPKIIPDISNEVLEKIHNSKKVLYNDYLKYAIKNEHLFNIIKLIKTDYIVAIATTASKENTMDILRYFNVENIFDYILTKEDVNEPKPSPEVFNKLMEITGIDKSNTVIFEDSKTGLKAANKSGANVIRVYGFN